MLVAKITTCSMIVVYSGNKFLSFQVLIFLLRSAF